MIKKIIHLVLTLVVLGVGIYFGMDLIKTAPETERRVLKKHIPLVDVIEVEKQFYTVQLNSRGTVTPRTESTLIPQVAGRVISISDHFRAGGFFEAGEELLQIDPIDYELALTSAKAERAKMRLALTEEKAQAKQAESDWKKLGMRGKPDALVMRKPQLAEVRASLASADAKVKRAEIDLSRTRIIAPYAGRVLEQQVDVGQYVSSGTTLAKIYATEYVEVRLPLTDRQLTFVDLPENYRGETVTRKGPRVDLSTELGGKNYIWQGRIKRTEGSIDTHSRQLFVIAQVDDPYARSENGRPPLKIGQFVRAKIEGQTLENVYVLPRSILVGTDGVLIAEQNDDQKYHVQRKTLEIIWQSSDNVVIRSGLTSGDQVISTPMPYATEGAEVRVAEKSIEMKPSHEADENIDDHFEANSHEGHAEH